MNVKKLEFYFLLIAIFAVGAISFFIFKPFLYVLIFAGIFAVIFQPLHKRILKLTRQKAGLAAFLSTLIIILCILIPLTSLGFQIFRESTQLYHSLSTGSDKGIMILAKDAIVKIQNALPGAINFSFDFDQYIKQAVNWLLANLGALFSNLANIFTGLFIFMVGLFYFLKDGQKLKSTAIKLSPLSEKDDLSILNKLETAVNSVIKGSLLVALIQGVVVTIGFLIFGVPNAFLWGSLAVVAALIPAIGTSLVTIPAILYLFLSGSIFQGFGMIIWAVLAVGLIDNFVSPKIVGKGMKMHPLITFISTLGGLAYFGVSGFVLGPLVVSILFALFDIYFSLADKTER